MLGPHCCVNFSLIVVSWGYSSLQGTGFSLCWLLFVAEHRLKGAWASVLAAPGPNSCGTRHMVLVAPWYVGSSWIMDWTCVSCIGRRIPYLWVTREAHPCLYDSVLPSPYLLPPPSSPPSSTRAADTIVHTPSCYLGLAVNDLSSWNQEVIMIGCLCLAFHAPLAITDP